MTPITERIYPNPDGMGIEAPRLALAWLLLGTLALALAGLFALLLVVARTPGFQALFTTQDLFRTALVVHVDQSVLIWFLAFASMLWSIGLHSPLSRRLGWISLMLSLTGCLLLAFTPLVGAVQPLMNNYVPVLRHPLFFIALLLFMAGTLLQSLTFLASVRNAGWRLLDQPLRVGLLTAALAFLMAVSVLLHSGWSLPPAGDTAGYYEVLFWGGGHLLQFAYTQLLLVAWLWLAHAGRVGWLLRGRSLSLILILGVMPLMTVPFIQLAYPVDSAEARLAYTRLMQFGNGVAVLPIGLSLLIGWWRSPPEHPASPASRALQGSFLLFFAGALLGSLIAGVNTVIPAHYHGAIVGITLAFMGLSYHLLPQLGMAAASGRMARLQPLIYTSGQFLHIGGLAYSGSMGVQRKTAGSAQGLELLQAKLPMAVMGLGGLLAVIGGILFVLVMVESVRRRP